MTERCDYCQRRLDRPGALSCGNGKHAIPTLAQMIAEAIVSDLNSRRGLGIEALPNDVQDDILDTWATLIDDQARAAIDKMFGSTS